jgi:epimerase EvaD
MHARKLAVDGAYEFTPDIFPDARGLFVSPFQESPFIEAVGHPLFPVAQSNHSKSKRGVIRGIHYTVTPPGTAKYVYCARGRAIDIVVDIRVGSPTFGVWDSVLLDQESFRSMYFPVGVGHAFIALDDDTVMSYMLSSRYVAENELALTPFDPAIGITVPEGLDIVQSERDTAAPTLAQAEAAGLLPEYVTCREIEETFRRSPLLASA